MLLTRVTLENYGVFRSRRDFDFNCSNEKPIILLGGRNGAGKTTLFESIMLCLYGQSFLEKKISRKEYEKFLSNKIHRYLGSKASDDLTSITVDFNFYHEGKETKYSVTRKWDNEDGRINEEFSVKVNEKPLDDVEQSEWQSFIEGLIPRGVSKLFFFDGEKIQKIAEEGSEDVEIKTSFDTLLGLDLVEQLQSDMVIYLSRQRGGKNEEVSTKLDQLMKEKEEQLDANKILAEKIASINVEIQTTTKSIQMIESKISKLGGGYATKREESRIRKIELERQLGIVENNIQELCSGLLPFCVIPQELKALGEQLRSDEEVLKQRFEKEILEKNFNNVKSDFASEKLWSSLGVNDAIKKKLVSKLEDILNENIGEDKSSQIGVINLSTAETTNILLLMDKIENDIPKQLEKETLEYNEIINELRKIQTILKNTPNDDEIGPLVSELNSLNETIGSLKKEIEYAEQKIVNNSSLLKVINSRIKGLVEEKHKDERTSAQVEAANKVQKVLDEYAKKLKEKKLQLLEQYLLESLDVLMHKTGFIDKVSINSDTFAITLYRKDGTEIDKEFLSKGEKQMLATSVLWALAKTSGKPLPFIIDTPLARLDLEHRENLIERFFPFAAHQVAIFSTNSEVDEKYYPKLKPYISRSYLIAYDPEKGETKVSKDEYFWDSKEGIVAL